MVVVDTMAKHIVKITVIGVPIVIRAIGRAIKEEMAMMQETAKKRSEWAKANTNKTTPVSTNITLNEAMKILNVDNLDSVNIRKNYEHLFAINNKTKGSSLYLQSKIFYAKKRIDMEMKSKGYEKF